MTQAGAIKEWLKHFAANAVAGILHGLIGFGVALVLASFVPVQIPINSFQQLIHFALTVSAGSVILGSVLAVESDGSTFKANRVFHFVREAVYPSDRNNGSRYTISTSFGLSIASKKSWQDYIFYI